MTRGKKLGLGLLIAGLVLVALEGGLRLAGVAPAYTPDIAGWRLPANLQDHTMQPANEPHHFTINTNDDGLRTKVRKEKPGGVFRVAVMGDSTAFGWGVDDGQDLPSQMERTLRPRSRKRIEMMNAAQPGYSTSQLSVLFHETVASYQPDVVLFFPPQHDHTPAAVSDWELMQGTQNLRVRLAQSSRIYGLLWNALGGQRGPDQAEGSLDSTGLLTVQRTNDDERAEALDGIQDALAAWDGQLVMGLMPFYPDLHHGPEQPGDDSPAVPWIRDYAKSRGLGLVDVRHCCGPDADAMVFEFDKWHLNARGNEAVGAATGEALADLLFGNR